MISIEELEKQIQEAKKGKAKVDSHYVGNASGLSHLFEYNYDYVGFLQDISYALKCGKARKEKKL
jgi:hypothetical protein